MSSSEQHTGLKDINRINSIDATIYPSDSLKSGEFILGDSKITYENAKENVVPKTEGEFNVLKKVYMSKPDFIETDLIGEVTNWIPAYVSDLYENESGERVYIVVMTPFGQYVFPYCVTYDSTHPLWDLVDRAGGDLMDVRGMDVYIQSRGGWVLNYKENIGRTEYKHIEQPISDHLETDDSHIFPRRSKMKILGTDYNRTWHLGIREEDKSERDDSTHGVINRIRDMF